MNWNDLNDNIIKIWKILIWTSRIFGELCLIWYPNKPLHTIGENIQLEHVALIIIGSELSIWKKKFIIYWCIYKSFELESIKNVAYWPLTRPTCHKKKCTSVNNRCIRSKRSGDQGRPWLSRGFNWVRKLVGEKMLEWGLCPREAGP